MRGLQPGTRVGAHAREIDMARNGLIEPTFSGTTTSGRAPGTGVAGTLGRGDGDAAPERKVGTSTS